MEMVVEHHLPHHHHQLQQHRHQQQPPSIDTDKLSYEIFSILESKFLFGYDDDGGGGVDGGHRQNPPGNHLQPHQQWVSKPMGGGPPDPPSLAAAVASLPPPPAAIKNQRGKVCILSVDGGAGLRGGILAGKALAYLEEALRSQSGDKDARISDYFDVAAGTGLGGIFTAMLFASGGAGGMGARPLYHADETWRFLSESGRRFFLSGRRRKGLVRSPTSKRRGFFGCFCGDDGGGTGSGEGDEEVAAATKGMEQSLKEAFGEQLTLRNTLKPVLIPCYDLLSSAPFLFSRADALEADSYDFRLWEVCRATAAEPGRFEPLQMRSLDGTTRCVAVDGGLAMSNPTAAAITHVLHNKQEFPFVRGVEDLMVLSVGTGGSSGCGGGASLSVATTDYEQLRRWRAKEWARPIARIASDGTADLVDHAVAMAFNNCRCGGNYVRIQAAAHTASAMAFAGPNSDNDPSPANVEQFVGMAESMLKQKNVESVLFGGKRIGEHTNSEKLDWFAGELVLEHQRRSCRIAPTVAFKQAPPASKPT